MGSTAASRWSDGQTRSRPRSNSDIEGQPVSWTDTPVGPPLDGAAPEPGAHTDEVLADLGLVPDDIARLRAEGVVE